MNLYKYTILYINKYLENALTSNRVMKKRSTILSNKGRIGIGTLDRYHMEKQTYQPQD